MKKNKRAWQIIRTKVGLKRFLKSQKRKNKKYNQFTDLSSVINKRKNNIYPRPLQYICDHISNISLDPLQLSSDNRLIVPSHFSLSNNAEKSYSFIAGLINLLHSGEVESFTIDYKNCEKIDVDAQVFMDIVLKYFLDYYKKKREKGSKVPIRKIDAININEIARRILFTIGSPRVLHGLKIEYPDITPYNLCIRQRGKGADGNKDIGQKEIDITNLVEYFITGLGKVGRLLTPDATKDLSQVIGEVLINAEEHSSTQYRFSTGYFEGVKEKEQHFGILNLVILNFGLTNKRGSLQSH